MSLSLQDLLKKHELVMADVDAFTSTISSLGEQSKKCKVITTYDIDDHSKSCPEYSVLYSEVSMVARKIIMVGSE